MSHDTAARSDDEWIEDQLMRLVTEPDPGWLTVARRLAGRLSWRVRGNGLLGFGGILPLLTSESTHTQFRAAYVFGYTVRSEIKVLDSVRSLPDTAQEWIWTAVRRYSGRPVSESVILALIHGLASEAAYWAANGLGFLGKSDPQVFALLVMGVEDPNRDVRGWCACLVDNLEELYASPADEDPVNGAPIRLIRDTIGPIVRHNGMLSPLVNAVCDPGLNRSVRSYALDRLAHAAASCPDEVAVSVARLQDVLREGPAELAPYAAIALGNLAPLEAQIAVPILVEAIAKGLDADDAERAAEALVRIDPRFSSDPKVVQILDDPVGFEGYC